jgi:membrane associated rhomboid family serine protease
VLLPYRAQNPPERFPYCTIALIALNTAIFALTSHNFFFIRREVVENYAVSYQTLSLGRLLTSLFLHSDLIHLGGNTLFLWIFGASVEGRLRPFKFLALYLLSGLGGSLLHELVAGIIAPDRFTLGASGAIMGLAGAYLYMFPYATLLLMGGFAVQARWVVAFYVGLDLLNAMVSTTDGVARAAHLGGFGVGVLMAFLFRAHRDSIAVSAVQATHAELQNYALLNRFDLERLLERPTDDMNLVQTYCEKAAMEYGDGRIDRCLEVIRQFARPLLAQSDLSRLARILLHIPPTAGGMPLVFYLRLASHLEATGAHDLAAQVYRRVYDLDPGAPDTEAALFRLAQLMERVYQNRAYAQATYTEMLRLFPNGHMALQARRALQPPRL